MAGGGGGWPGGDVSARGSRGGLKGSERPEAGCLGELCSFLFSLLKRS